MQIPAVCDQPRYAISALAASYGKWKVKTWRKGASVAFMEQKQKKKKIYIYQYVWVHMNDILII